jgi:hypothetical protein
VASRKNRPRSKGLRSRGTTMVEPGGMRLTLLYENQPL